MWLKEFFRNNKFWMVLTGVFFAQFFLLYSSATVVLACLSLMYDSFNCLFDKVAYGMGLGVLYGAMAIFVMDLPTKVMENWSAGSPEGKDDERMP